MPSAICFNLDQLKILSSSNWIQTNFLSIANENPILWFQIFFCLKNLTVNPSPHSNTFWRPWETSLLKTLRQKEKLLVTSNFSFIHSVFYPFRELSEIFIKF